MHVCELVYSLQTVFSLGLNSILLINRHIQQDKDIYGTGSDRKLKAYINHLLIYKSSPEII